MWQDIYPQFLNKFALLFPKQSIKTVHQKPCSINFWVWHLTFVETLSVCSWKSLRGHLFKSRCLHDSSFLIVSSFRLVFYCCESLIHVSDQVLFLWTQSSCELEGPVGLSHILGLFMLWSSTYFFDSRLHNSTLEKMCAFCAYLLNCW